MTPLRSLRLVCSAFAFVPGVLGAAVTFSNSSTPAITSPATTAAPTADPGLIYDGTTYHKIFSDIYPQLSGLNLTTAKADWCEASSEAWTSEFQTAWSTETITEPTFPTTGDWADLPTVPPVVTVTLPVATGSAQNPYHCCGNCTINFYDIVIKFWPDPKANYDCLANQTATRQLLSAPSVIPRAEPTRKWAEPLITPGAVLRPRADGEQVSVVSDGVTYYSPSVYINIPYAAAADNCGILGSPKVSTLLSFNPNELSTLGPTPCSDVATNTFTEQICNVAKPFNPTDLPCAPASVTTLASSLWYHPDVYKPGWDYAPYFVAPPQFTALDPNWQNCLAGPGHDPFTFLTPFASLETPTTSAEPGPSPTAVPESTTASAFNPDPITTSKAADPISTPSSTPSPTKEDPAPTPTSEPSDPEGPSPSPNDPPASSPDPTPDPPNSDPSPTTHSDGGSSSKPSDPAGSSPDPSPQPSPSDPDTPSGDPSSGQNPAGPSSPSSPSDPSNPSNPSSPSSPSNPSDPSSPSDPSDPSNPSNPSTPSNPSDSQPGQEGNPSDSNPNNSAPSAGASQTAFTPSIIQTTISGTPTAFTSNIPIPIPASPTLQVLTTAGHTISILPSHSGVIVDGNTVQAGSVATISNTPISIAPTGGVAVIGSSTISIPTPAPAGGAGGDDSPAAVTQAGHTFSALPSGSGLAIDGSTFTPGQTATLSGTPIIIPTSGNDLVFGTSTIPLPTPAPAAGDSTPAAITQAGHTFSALPSGSGLAIDGHTFTAGQTATLSGTPIIIPTAGNSLVFGTTTLSLPSLPSFPTPSTPTPFSFQPAPAFTAAGETFSPVASGLVVDGTTVKPGEAVTVGGTVVSVPSEGGEVVVGTSTVGLAETTQPGIGGVVISALGTGGVGGASGTGTAGVAVATGAAGKVQGRWHWAVEGVVAGVVVVWGM